MTTVAYIAGTFPSPLETYVMDEIKELRRRGVRVICCSGKKAREAGLSAEERKFREETHAFHPLPFWELARTARRWVDQQGQLRPLRYCIERDRSSKPRQLRFHAHTFLGLALADYLARYDVNHIHAHHGFFASWMALVASRLLGIDFSFTLHGSDLLLGKGDLLAEKLERCRFCVTISNFNRNFILQHYPLTPSSKILVQRLGVDVTADALDLSRSIDPATLSILSVGRLHPVKDHAFLVQACAALRNEGVEFTCRIAGEGPERDALRRQIAASHLEFRVILLGHVARADLSRFYRSADIFILTSRSEGIPVTLMEAMAQGRIVIAPEINGIPELVEHGRNGFLYRSESMTDLLATVRWILSNPAGLEQVRRAAVHTISLYYDRQQNVRDFADHFLERISRQQAYHARPLLQQV